jgi:hypothetical protein
MFLINHPPPTRTMLFSLGFFLYLVSVAASFNCPFLLPLHPSLSRHFHFSSSHCRPSRCFSFSPPLIHLPPEDHHFLLGLPLQHQLPLAQQRLLPSDASSRDEPCLSKALPRHCVLFPSRPLKWSSPQNHSHTKHDALTGRPHRSNFHILSEAPSARARRSSSSASLHRNTRMPEDTAYIEG